MPRTRPKDDAERRAPPAVRPPGRPEPAPDGRDFRASFGEDLRDVLDVDTWQPGGELVREFQRIEREVREAVRQEDDLQRRIRADLFPRLFNPATAPPGGGVYRADPDVLQAVHR